MTIVFETARSARIDSLADVSGPMGVAARESGIRAAVGTPILVEGRLWGVVIAGSTQDEPLPPRTEARLASFTELVATAIANAESQAGLARLAEEQAALRRVATLVAGGRAPDEVFAAVTAEVERLLPVDFAHLGRYEPDGTITVLATCGSTAEHFPVGRRWRLGGKNLTTIVFETHSRTTRIGHIRSRGLLSPAAGMAPVVRCRARTTTDKAGSVPMQACRQPLTRDFDRSVLDRRIRSSAAAITRLDPGDPDVA